MSGKEHMQRLLRFKWMVLLCGAVFAITAAAVSSEQPKTYQSTAVALVTPKQLLGPAVTDPNQPQPSVDQLVETYVSLINTEPVRLRLVSDGIPRSQDQLAGEIFAQRQGFGTLIGITATDHDPAVAHLIAQDIIPAFNLSLRELQARVKTSTTDTTLESLVPWEVPANPPAAPSGPDIPRNTIIALVAGLLLGIAVVFILDALDDTVKTESELQPRFGLSMLASVLDHHRVGAAVHEDGPVELIAATQTDDPVSEEYRAMRTNLQFSAVGRTAKSLVITSSVPGEGKTTTATNLAVVLAQGGTRVVLIDADFRRPSLHKVFAVDSSVGLGNLILGNKKPTQVLSPTSIPNLRVMCTGPIPPNPSEVLGSETMGEILETLCDRIGADILIFDAPPIIPVTDATVLAACADGAILVIEAGRTRIAQVKQSLNRLAAVDVNVLGAVLNKTRMSAGAEYYFYYGRSGDPETGGKRGKRRRSEKPPPHPVTPATPAVNGSPTRKAREPRAAAAPKPAAVAPKPAVVAPRPSVVPAAEAAIADVATIAEQAVVAEEATPAGRPAPPRTRTPARRKVRPAEAVPPPQAPPKRRRSARTAPPATEPATVEAAEAVAAEPAENGAATPDAGPAEPTPAPVPRRTRRRPAVPPAAAVAPAGAVTPGAEVLPAADVSPQPAADAPPEPEATAETHPVQVAATSEPTDEPTLAAEPAPADLARAGSAGGGHPVSQTSDL